MSDPEQPLGELRNAQGERLDYAVHPAQGDDLGLLVVIGHGVTANKDRAWAQTLARTLAGAGYTALRFSFAGNGDSEGDFRECTVSKEVQDLSAVLDAAQAAGLGPRLAFAGHSMGGAVAVLAAVQDPRIELLISLAGMVHTAAIARRKFGELTPGQDVMWDKPECPLSQTFLADMNAVDSTLPRAGEVRVPWLLVHGTADTVVPVDESRQIKAACPQVGLVEIDGADHLFSGEPEQQAADAVIRWLQRQLS